MKTQKNKWLLLDLFKKQFKVMNNAQVYSLQSIDSFDYYATVQLILQNQTSNIRFSFENWSLKYLCNYNWWEVDGHIFLFFYDYLSG